MTCKVLHTRGCAQDDGTEASEECPICLLHYPAVNETECCHKGLCTECFLQVSLTRMQPRQDQNLQFTLSCVLQVQVRTQTEHKGALCPFCKTQLRVLYRGPKSEAERSLARDEEARVLQALTLARLVREPCHMHSAAAGSRTFVGRPRGSLRLGELRPLKRLADLSAAQTLPPEAWNDAGRPDLTRQPACAGRGSGSSRAR